MQRSLLAIVFLACCALAAPTTATAQSSEPEQPPKVEVSSLSAIGEVRATDE